MAANNGKIIKQCIQDLGNKVNMLSDYGIMYMFNGLDRVQNQLHIKKYCVNCILSLTVRHGQIDPGIDKYKIIDIINLKILEELESTTGPDIGNNSKNIQVRSRFQVQVNT